MATRFSMAKGFETIVTIEYIRKLSYKADNLTKRRRAEMEVIQPDISMMRAADIVIHRRRVQTSGEYGTPPW